jgi:predicted enzyme related to lactoylglutathione lyase
MSQLVLYGAIIYAKDYRALASFYEHVAGLTQREADEEYVLLEAAAFQLVILQIPERIAANITIQKPPRKRENTPIKLFLNVSSIEIARQMAKGLGGELNGAEKEWEFHGVKALRWHRPRGQRVSATRGSSVTRPAHREVPTNAAHQTRRASYPSRSTSSKWIRCDIVPAFWKLNVRWAANPETRYYAMTKLLNASDKAGVIHQSVHQIPIDGRPSGSQPRRAAWTSERFKQFLPRQRAASSIIDQVLERHHEIVV